MLICLSYESNETNMKKGRWIRIDSYRKVTKIKETEKALCAADIYLMTSETESFGVSALEAMAASVPVISTNTGGIPEVNKHGETGYLSNVGDIEDMAKNTIKLLEDKKLYNRISMNAAANANKFNIRNILPRYLNLYYKAIS